MTEMKLTIKKASELTTTGYKDMGIYTAHSKELEELNKDGRHTEVLLRKIDEEGKIFSVFVK